MINRNTLDYRFIYMQQGGIYHVNINEFLEHDFHTINQVNIGRISKV